MDSTGPSLSSLVITLSDDPPQRAAALATLATRPDLELGETGGPWLPAVLESTDANSAFRELEAIRGVTLVEVVFVELTHPQTSSRGLPSFAA
jgi:hypothetical protein